MPRLLELFCGTKSIGRAFEAAGWEVVSLDIVSKFEPTILCDIRSWDYTQFPPGHFDMVWASPVCRGLEIMAHFDPAHVGHRESGHRAAEDPTVHGAPALGGRYLLQVRDSVQEADPAVDQHALEAEPRAVQERQPVRCVGRREASEGRPRGASTHGGPA